MVDLDTGITDTAVNPPVDGGPVEGFEGAELTYFADTCNGLGDYVLQSLRGARVGLLPADRPQTFEACRAVTGVGLAATEPGSGAAESYGFVEGAAICASTDQGAVAMAVIDVITSGFDPTVTGPLYVWRARE